MIPEGLRPGIGLRPGGERPDLEDAVVALFDALYASVVACSRSGLNVVVDVGHHDDYSKPLGILAKVAGELRSLPAYFVGVRCPVEVIMARRDAGAADSGYARSAPDGTVPEVVVRLGAGGARSGPLRPGGRHVEGFARGLRRRRCAPARRGATGGLRRAGRALRLSRLPNYDCNMADGLPEPGPAVGPRRLESEVPHMATCKRRRHISGSADA